MSQLSLLARESPNNVPVMDVCFQDIPSINCVTHFTLNDYLWYSIWELDSLLCTYLSINADTRSDDLITLGMQALNCNVHVRACSQLHVCLYIVCMYSSNHVSNALKSFGCVINGVSQIIEAVCPPGIWNFGRVDSLFLPLPLSLSLLPSLLPPPSPQDIVDTHPGLAFLATAPEFHARYVETVSMASSPTHGLVMSVLIITMMSSPLSCTLLYMDDDVMYNYRS